MTAGGWANRTNCFIVADNLTLPPAQWLCVGTNLSDLSGNSRFTNPIPASAAQRFYRVRLP